MHRRFVLSPSPPQTIFAPELAVNECIDLSIVSYAIEMPAEAAGITRHFTIGGNDG